MTNFASSVSRRQLFMGVAVAVSAIALSRLPAQTQVFGKQGRAVALYAVAPLPYAYDSLDNTIDTLTMRLHHDKHYAGYIKKLNAAVAGYPRFDAQNSAGTHLQFGRVARRRAHGDS